jgi:uncharacterized protein YdaT
MSWLEHHTQSEKYASQAEELLKLQTSQAAEFYRLATDAEVQALENLDPAKTRTLGVTVVSAASLYYKAGDLSTAKNIAYKWLAVDVLPEFAKEELHELARDIEQKEVQVSSKGERSLHLLVAYSQLLSMVWNLMNLVLKPNFRLVESFFKLFLHRP